MGRIAMRKVHVRDDDGRKFTYEAGDEVADKHLEYISNEGVWVGEGDFNPGADANDLDIEDDDLQDALSKLNVRQLAKLCQDKNVQMPANARKTDLLIALRSSGVTSVG